MLESDKRYLPNGGNGLQFHNEFAIPQKSATKSVKKAKLSSQTSKLDARKLAAALTHRDYVNQLMGF